MNIDTITRRNFLKRAGAVLITPADYLSRQAKLDDAVRKELGKSPKYIERFIYDPDGSLAREATVESFGEIPGLLLKIFDESDAITISKGYGSGIISRSYFRESAFSQRHLRNENGLVVAVNSDELLQVTVGHENTHGKINQTNDLGNLDLDVGNFVAESMACIEDIKKLRYGMFGKSRTTFNYVFSENLRILSELERGIIPSSHAPSRLMFDKQVKINDEFFSSYISNN